MEKAKRKKVKPLLAIMSPRDIPWVKAKMDKIDYVDKVWFKYTETDKTMVRIQNYFMKHKEYTHLILHADDGAPEYEHIAMLIADAEKYDFPVITGCCCVDKIREDYSLNLTFDPVVKSRKQIRLSRAFYKNLPNEFLELNGIIKVWFQGNALAMIRRDTIYKIGGLRCWLNRFGCDLRFSFECWKHGVEQHADLRVYMNHFKYSQSVPPFNLLLGRRPRIIIQKATAPIPKATAGKMVDKIPEKYQKLMDFYYGKSIALKICIVTEFEQEGYFQWHTALRRFSGSQVRYVEAKRQIQGQMGHVTRIHSVVMNASTRKLYPKNHEYWNPIRKADLVFVYVARQNEKDNWKWYMLPVWTKELMENEKAKMICQFDNEFMWLFNPQHVYWKKLVHYDGSPEEFFKESKVLDVADAYFTVIDNPPWREYCEKPIYYMPLPQLSRYEGKIVNFGRRIRSGIPSVKKIVVLRHSVKSATATRTLDNLAKNFPNNPIIYFTTEKTTHQEKLNLLKRLPRKSVVYGKIARDAYMTFLPRGYIAIDDNDGYRGWSRFAMECALAGVPCIGSTRAIKHIFPDLYTKHKDTDRQNFLLRKFLKDEHFWKLHMICGSVTSTIGLASPSLITKLLKIAIFDLHCPNVTITKLTAKYASLVDFLVSLQPRMLSIPLRPLKGNKIHDKISKGIIDTDRWDDLYGEWRTIIEDEKAYKRCKAIARQKYMRAT